jgi:hypothetical protein
LLRRRKVCQDTESRDDGDRRLAPLESFGKDGRFLAHP